jgi:hypothetical protein
MAVVATIVDAGTGAVVQKMTFGRMPRPGSGFVLEGGQQVVARRVEVGKPAPGKFIAPVTIWVAGAADRRQP